MYINKTVHFGRSILPYHVERYKRINICMKLSPCVLLRPIGGLRGLRIFGIPFLRSYSSSKISQSPEYSDVTLSDNDIEIIRRHTLACKAKKETYIDPETGYMVFTEYFHKERGSCCGNICRHCPYGHRNVPENLRTMKYNSVFYK
eukprot:Seg1614.9 transcript_id=Seg1614.9/GoldUCD/mRNA.D3Y31 product="putative protein C1orf53" protein_id=Seg1614.9/GoldUCD/D3Y31